MRAREGNRHNLAPGDRKRIDELRRTGTMRCIPRSIAQPDVASSPEAGPRRGGVVPKTKRRKEGWGKSAQKSGILGTGRIIHSYRREESWQGRASSPHQGSLSGPHVLRRTAEPTPLPLRGPQASGRASMLMSTPHRVSRSRHRLRSHPDGPSALVRQLRRSEPRCDVSTELLTIIDGWGLA